jgi:hypothetical protein
MKVYKCVLRDVSTTTGGKIINARWVRVNKGPKEKPIVRCRLVAMEFNNTEIRDDLFAGTPPLYAVKIVISYAASHGSESGIKIMLVDVKCAFVYGEATRDVYIELPPEDQMSRTGLHIGHIWHQRGARNLANMCEEQWACTLVSCIQLYIITVFDWILAHVDDFLCVGAEADLLWCHFELGKNTNS